MKKYIRTKDNEVHKVIDESVEFLYVHPNPSDGMRFIRTVVITDMKL